MDYYKSLWLKRKAQREAENAKNEAAHALTALSAAFTSSPKIAQAATSPLGMGSSFFDTFWLLGIAYL